MNEPPTPSRSTRGRTRPLRLRALDRYLIARAPSLLARDEGPWRDAPVVDVGLGDTPATTVELARALHAHFPRLEIRGVDHDPARIAAAQPFATPRLRFLHGGFEDLAALPRRARLVRVMNVLRGYPLEEARRAHALLGEALLDGGLALEGSSDPEGGILTAHLLRREGAALVREALLFHADGTRGFAPWMFRDWLPRDLRRSVRPGTAVHAFLSEWASVCEAHREADPRLTFARAAGALAAREPSVRADPELFAEGTLVWAPPGGVPVVP